MKLSQVIRKSKMSAAAIDDVETFEETARKNSEDRVARLTPCRRYVFDQLMTVSDAIADRFTTSRTGLLVVHVPSEEWMETVGKAARVAIQAVIAVDLVAFSTVRSEDVRRSDEPVLDESALIQDLARVHVVCLLLPGEEISSVVRELTDVEITITSLDADRAFGMLASRYPDIRSSDLQRIQFSELAPERIDLALQRAANGMDAVRLLEAFTGLALEEKARAAKEDETIVEERRGPFLEDLHGYGEAKEWGLRLVADLRLYAAGDLRWSEVDAGALFVGPPGTGKTQLAGAIAASAGCSFFPTSYAEWQSSRDGHLGSLMKALRKTFADAAANTPAIVFIDELDSFQARGRGGYRDDWWTSIMNGLLECLDGTSRREGVVVIAACNDASQIDAALVRSGRLDRKFFIGLPDEEALAAILMSYLREERLGAAVSKVASVMAGTMSGADALRVAREARQSARHSKRDLRDEDLLSAVMPAGNETSGVLRRIAIHEAGHAVARIVQGLVPQSLTIGSSGGGGFVRYGFDERHGEGRREDFEEMIVSVLAGRAAEQVLMGSVSSGSGGKPESDLATATRMIAAMEAKLGLGRSLAYVERVDDRLVEAELQRLYSQTLLLVGRHRKAIEDLAELALERRVLGHRDLVEFANTL